jgi:hypothetical protein
VIAALALLLLVLSARFTRDLGPRAGLWLVAASVLWLVCDKPMEGSTVLRVSKNHGVTAADLTGFAGVALGLHQARSLVVRRARRLSPSRRGRR